MSISELFLILPGPAVVSLMFWFLVLSVVLYLARTPAHRALVSITRALHKGLRLSASSVLKVKDHLALRNREVLLAAGRESAERMLEREFERVEALVQRDLAEYPALHRRMSEEIKRIDEDYQASTDVPPAPPGWLKAVESVAKIPSAGDPMVAHVLRDIHESLNKAHVGAMEEYRKNSRHRHALLKRMMPHWRRVLQLLGRVDKNVQSLLDRVKTIDRQMNDYEEIVKGSDRAVRMLSSSSVTQFFISAFVLVIAVGGAIINFNLIARPLQEMVGGNTYLVGFRVADIAALVLICLEIAVGLFLMECFRITRLFPVIGALEDRIRRRMAWVAFTMLLFFASIESALAYMRELMAQDDAALVAGLLGGHEMAVDAGGRWITTATQMGMGFILPFVLTFVAIPLESFVHSLRTVLGVAGVGLLHMTAFTLRLLGSLFHYAGSASVHVYDVLIFGPLWAERQLRERKASAAGRDDEAHSARRVGTATAGG